MTPVMISNQKSWEKDIPKIETMFKKPVSKSPFNAKYPYFNLLTKGNAPVDKKIILKLKNEGWSTNVHESSLNFWRNPINLEIPKGIQVKIGNYFDKSIYPGFLKTMEDNFSCDDVFMKTFNKMMKNVEKDVLSVLICKNDKVLGAVLIAVKNSGAYLMCGSINKAYRKKNLWNVLLASAQSASVGKGAKFWVYSTNAPQLLWRGDETYRNTVFIKKPIQL
ncbi:hypothetical protein SHI21_08685 [Bacteriovorax sp. PP10]|uniref:N-acetyltransferase domain-containing protein n=1 Tax=Bacteriovorax antarcticus TaxID=3088717 RepID=A0ABU5VT96_9BACT|nr:hypothetical protein [Bacteriovorax sp. PP10]MEA9356276.1 hypothetical protein [Bacteriovorax sp. PP10]